MNLRRNKSKGPATTQNIGRFSLKVLGPTSRKPTLISTRNSEYTGRTHEVDPTGLWKNTSGQRIRAPLSNVELARQLAGPRLREIEASRWRYEPKLPIGKCLADLYTKLR